LEVIVFVEPMELPVPLSK